jgi:predicted phosphodiesterase
MKIHLLSDLHLEIDPDFKLEKPNDTNGLILAGDIGDPASIHYKELIKQASELYQWVVVVRGNHEAYGYKSITIASEKIGKACAPYSNVHYLQKDSLDLEEDIRIIGATLWSDIMDYQRSEIGAYISDYYKIKEWSIEHNNHEHFKDLRFIKSEMEKAIQDGKRLIVVTHHAPYTINTSKPEYRFSPLSSAFATDLSKLFKPPIVTWVYGHTHYCNHQIINGVNLISNQRGYSDEDTGFNPLFTFHV